MSVAIYTAAPLHVNRDIKEERLYVSDAQGHRLAEVWGGINEDTDALARLFAAAPDLLAALKAMLDPDAEGDIEQAVRAIAKAEGRS